MDVIHSISIFFFFFFLQNSAGDQVPEVKVIKHSNNETDTHLVCGTPINSIVNFFLFIP